MNGIMRGKFMQWRSMCVLCLMASEIFLSTWMNATRVWASEPVDVSDLTFLLTFDKNSVISDVARGNRVSTTFHDNLEFRVLPGINGNNAFLLKKGESLKYDVIKNIDHRQGTLAIWLMADNYDPRDVGPPGPERSHKSFVNILFKNGKELWRQAGAMSAPALKAVIEARV